jgi:hypothetical protein
MFVLAAYCFTNTYPRPIMRMGAHVAPGSMGDYWITHNFKYPCCLCTHNEHESDYTEAAIYIPMYGLYADKYVAGCASKNCRYLSMLLLL